MILHYQPLCPTTDLSNFSLVVAPDGAHPLVGVAGSAYLDFPTVTTCEVGPNSVSFAGWEPWSAEFVIDNAKKFMYQVPVYGGSTGIGTNLFSEPDTRGCSFGSMSCAFSGVSATSTTAVKGVLYWELDLHLMGPVPIGIGATDFSLEKPCTTFASAFTTASVPTSMLSASPPDRWVRLPDDDTSPSPRKEERKASRK
jgi:hypothetical protein